MLMGTQTAAGSVVCDEWDWPHSEKVDFFRRLLADQPFQFELGLRQSNQRWFQLPSNADLDVLRERQLFIGHRPSECVFWTPVADPIFAELTEQFRGFPPAMGSNSTGAGAAAGLSTQWPPDFILLQPGESGKFRMAGGVVCFPSGWAPEEKLGLPIDQIHAPVPGLNDALGDRIQRFLGRLTPRVSFERLNWGLAPTPDRRRHPLHGMASFTRGFPLEKGWLRVEHQSFHALPQTGGIAFLIHVTIHSVAELLIDPQTCVGLLRQLQTMSEEVTKYKGLAEVRNAWVQWLLAQQK